MECMFLFVLILTLSVSEDLVQAKTITCADWYSYSPECKISDVRPQDSIEVVISSLSRFFPQENSSLSSQTTTSGPLWLQDSTSQSLQPTIGLTIFNSAMNDFPPISFINSVRLYFLNCVGCGLTDISEHTFTPLLLTNLFTLDISSGSFSKF